MSRRLCFVGFLAVVAGVVAPTTAFGADDRSTGGASAPAAVKLARAVCATGNEWTCGRGQKLTLLGKGMDGVDRIDFLGARGRRDDRVARPVGAKPAQLTLVVPLAARSGQLRLHSITSGTVDAPRPLTVASTRKASRPGLATNGFPAAGTFPIDGQHDMGQTPTNGFGGGRGHQGQDLFAACGTPLVAVRDTTVQQAGYQSRAGNYVVLQDATGGSYTYMHMRSASVVKTGALVTEGQQIGYVGDTGDAHGCHLHFELWTAPGWRTGGHPIDPLPQLRLWHRHDGDHR